MYKLIINHHLTNGPIPYYAIMIEDPQGNTIGNVTRAVITIDPNESVYPMMTIRMRNQDGEEIRENLPVDIVAK